MVSALARKIRQYGFRILYFDGKYQHIHSSKFEMPPKIIEHKPDIVGVKGDDYFCIGEAKTSSDIFSKRTRTQIADFLMLVKTNPGNKLLLGIPIKSKNDLQYLLTKLGYQYENQIEIMYFPDKLLPHEEI